MFEVTWGEKGFQPVQFNGFRTGPLKATAVVRPGESLEDAVVRVWASLNAAAQRIFAEESEEYLRNLQAMYERAGRR